MELSPAMAIRIVEEPSNTDATVNRLVGLQDSDGLKKLILQEPTTVLKTIRTIPYSQLPARWQP